MNEDRKIDPLKLERLLTKGKTGQECAKYFNVSASAISQARKGLNVGVVKSVCLENAHRIVNKNLDTVTQLQKINEVAMRMLDEAQENPDISIRVMSEIRAQLKLQLDMFQMLYDVKAVQEFQEEVLTAIQEESPDARDRIVNRLAKRRAIRAAIRFDKP